MDPAKSFQHFSSSDKAPCPSGGALVNGPPCETISHVRNSFVDALTGSAGGLYIDSKEISHPKPVPIAIMGVPFDNVTTAQALEAIERRVALGRPHYLVTANVDFLVQAHEDVELRRILVEADLVLCDGTPLVWVSRLLGNPLPERV